MEGEPDLPAPPSEAKFLKPNFSRPININPDSINHSRTFNTTSTCTSTTSSSSSSPSEGVRRFHAFLKRRRPLGIMQSNAMRPRRCLVSQRETPNESLITPPSEPVTTVNTHEESYEPYHNQRDQPGLPTRSVNNDAVASKEMESGKVLAEVQRKVHFSTENIATSRGADDQTGDLLSHMGSLALTEMEWDVVSNNQAENASANFQNNMEMDNTLRSAGQITSSLARTTMGVQEQMHHFGNFLQNDLSNAMTQSSGVGHSCVTSTIINSTAPPMISSTTFREAKVVSHHAAVTSEAVTSKSSPKKPQYALLQDNYNVSKDSPHEDNNTAKENVTDVKTRPQSSKSRPLDAKLENSTSEKVERGGSDRAASTSRRKGYNPDLFFKVNGKLYQRLGKIGSGGSSEVHKVISSDCTIYALKKIKLKGRDYATAYGFCQEIGYLKKLKGKNNIIQLIDYEVTDKTLLEAVINGCCMSNKDGRVKDDGYIYMVLEYGEIDLAHMLSKKWKELDDSDATIDQNWLRFYWQQILQAVNTIHEERIVHSDLKPANFLLVSGSLKLIDFGIAKAIMSDTTNIQRDSQVGTLSYMSPEAFMCNETDANGNTIKCGRPSDIWSLGCILYQMVYGRTPFSEYKTFWAKFKVITNPNHMIVYEPVPNPWLLDLMKKCLAWDRNKRCRIPELLQHPFLVPPVPAKLPSDQNCTLFQLVAESSANDQTALNLCSQLRTMLIEPRSLAQSEQSVSRDQLRKLLCKISTLSFQLQEHLASL